MKTAIKHYEYNLKQFRLNMNKYIDLLVSAKNNWCLLDALNADHIYIDGSHCSLCLEAGHCAYCILGKTGHKHCVGTPWAYLHDYITTPMLINDEQSAVKCVNQILKAFEDELEFLKGVTE